MIMEKLFAIWSAIPLDQQAVIIVTLEVVAVMMTIIIAVALLTLAGRAAAAVG